VGFPLLVVHLSPRRDARAALPLHMETLARGLGHPMPGVVRVSAGRCFKTAAPNFIKSPALRLQPTESATCQIPFLLQ